MGGREAFPREPGQEQGLWNGTAYLAQFDVARG